MNEKRQIRTSHSNYEILRRLPADINALTAMCDALKTDFAGKGLIESEESKQHRTKIRKRPNYRRDITPESEQLLSQTAEILNITTTQLIALLVVINNPDPSWTVGHKRPPIKTVRSRRWVKRHRRQSDS